MADVIAESLPAIEDKFFTDKPTGVVAASPAEEKKPESSATPAEKAGAVQTEAASEPADTELEPAEAKTPAADKSVRSNWATMRAARYRAEAEAKLLREQLAERDKAKPAAAAAVVEVKPAVDPALKPKSEDYATYDEFLDARDKHNRFLWESEQTRNRTDAEAAQAKTEREAKSAKHLADWNKVEAVTKAKNAGYPAAFDAFFAVARTNAALAGSVFESAIGPDLALHLGVTPAELERIAALSEREIWKEIGKLEDRLATKGSETHITKAPRPLAKVEGDAARPEKDRSMEDRFYKD